tara:strand:+ start:6368 stop:7147 length:780 start_codon:yes stop_codon:yes gene_type:complete
MPHISFSELKEWNLCPFRHKVQYIDKNRIFEGNIYTAFGTALHTICEGITTKQYNTLEEQKRQFKIAFTEQVINLPESEHERLNEELIAEFEQQGLQLVSKILPALQEKFGNFTVVSVEERLYEPLEEYEGWKFKGFIDLVLKTEDEKYHVIDWKSCSWGWDAERRSDKITGYQPTLYKKFWCDKHGVDPKDVEIYFALLKRTATKNRVEIFRVTSGPRKIKNALNLLNAAVYNITKKNHIKNRLNCGKCSLHKTKLCP